MKNSEYSKRSHPPEFRAVNPAELALHLYLAEPLRNA